MFSACGGLETSFFTIQRYKLAKTVRNEILKIKLFIKSLREYGGVKLSMISCWNNFMFLVIVIPNKPPFKSKFESKATVLYCKPSLKYRNELMVLNLATD